MHVLQKKVPRKHPQYIKKINDDTDSSKEEILLSKVKCMEVKKNQFIIAQSFTIPFVYELLS
jgi:hypothetical protein